MTWLQLILKNGLRSAHRYVNYLTACAFAVMVFYMFSAFVLNPAVSHGNMTATAKELLTACQFIVIVFAVFFIFFFHGGLLRLRNKEFGLLLTLGMTPKQIGRLIFVESVLLGIIATGGGMVLGILFSKLFLLILGAVLALPQQLPFVIPRGSIIMTAIFFGLVFIGESFWVSRQTRRRSPKNLILGQRTKQKTPKFSLWSVFLGVLCLAIGYYLAISQSRNVVIDLFPILILTGAGTYLLFSQILVMILTYLRQRPLGGIELLVVSRLAYRLKDHARVLTVVTMLTAVVLTGMGSVLGLQQILTINAMRVDPYGVMIATNQSTQKSSQLVNQAQRVLNEHHLQVTSESSETIIVGQILTKSNQWIDVQILPSSTFDALRRELIQYEPSLQKYLSALPPIRSGHAELLVPYPLMMPNQLALTRTKVRLSGDAVAKSITVNGQSDIRVINEQSSILPDFEFVVSNRDFAKWESLVPPTSKWHIHGFLLPDWKHSQTSVQQIMSFSTGASKNGVSATVNGYVQAQQVVSVMLFAGFFISILFFLTAGGSIYFRLDAQQEEDQRQFRALQRMGLHRKEIGRVVTTELFLLFFVPVLMALLHTTIAMIDFGHLVPITGDAWMILGSVVGVYCILTFIYFWVSRVRYLRRVTDEL